MSGPSKADWLRELAHAQHLDAAFYGRGSYSMKRVDAHRTAARLLRAEAARIERGEKAKRGKKR